MAVVCAIMLGTVSPSAALSPVWGYSYEQLAAEWWKWALSIPGYVSPLYDETGEYCGVGQHGDVWFLANWWDDSVTRDCSVPQGMPLFFPVVNSMYFNAPPTLCEGSFTVAAMRAYNASNVNQAFNKSASLDGKPLRMQREQSVVFAVNFLIYGDDPYCPAGIYSPAVDDGYYVFLSPLTPGTHTLNIHAEFPGPWVQDITYTLTVVPVILK